jgi:hypothetical protein
MVAPSISPRICSKSTQQKGSGPAWYTKTSGVAAVPGQHATANIPGPPSVTMARARRAAREIGPVVRDTRNFWLFQRERPQGPKTARHGIRP